MVTSVFPSACGYELDGKRDDQLPITSSKKSQSSRPGTAFRGRGGSLWLGLIYLSHLIFNIYFIFWANLVFALTCMF